MSPAKIMYAADIANHLRILAVRQAGTSKAEHLELAYGFGGLGTALHFADAEALHFAGLLDRAVNRLATEPQGPEGPALTSLTPLGKVQAIIYAYPADSLPTGEQEGRIDLALSTADRHGPKVRISLTPHMAGAMASALRAARQALKQVDVLFAIDAAVQEG